MSEPSVARRIARFTLALRLDDAPAPVVERATLLTLDTLGSCLASSTMDFGRAAIHAAERLAGPPESSLVGAKSKVGAANAVLANGTLAHGLDFDDTREDAIVHTGCVAVPTALALGESVNASGRSILEALIAGVEVMCRIGLAVPGRFHARHFHPTALTGAFAAAAVAGKLAALPEDQLVHALGIAGSQASGIIEYLADGSSTKRLHPGWAAHAGVVATILAQAGLTGPASVFEGEHGFYRAFADGAPAGRMRELLDSLGRTWELGELTFKPYPCGSIAHPYMDCAARLRLRHAITPEAIVAVHCRTAAGPIPRLWEPLAAKQRPANGYAAKFSLPYLLAVVLLRGTAGLSDFTDAAVADEAVLRLAARVTYEVDPTIDYPRQFVGRVSVTLDDGRVLTESQDRPRGGPDLPLQRTELEDKFRANAGLAMPPDRIERLIAEVAALPTAPHVTPLMELLAL